MATAKQPFKLVEGVDFYMEGSKLVFTATYHLKRGFCCNSRCRHCPYRDGAPMQRIEIEGPTAGVPPKRTP
jgi:hypothetical protein